MISFILQELILFRQELHLAFFARDTLTFTDPNGNIKFGYETTVPVNLVKMLPKDKKLS